MTHPMDDFDDEFDDGQDGIIDEDAVRQIIEKARDALRPLGLTLVDEGIAIQYAQGHLHALLPCVIRPSAKEKVQQDQASREAFNKMMAEQHELKIQQDADKIKQAIQDPEKLLDALFGDGDDGECAHERKHPSTGHCLDCGAGLE